MRFSARSSRMLDAAMVLTDMGEASPAWALHRRAVADLAEGRPVGGVPPIVASGEHGPFSTPEGARRTVAAAAHSAVMDEDGAAAEANVAAEMRRRIADGLSARAATVFGRDAPLWKEQSVSLACGLGPALTTVLQTLIDDGDDVMLLDPSAPWIAAATVAAGGAPVWARLSPDRAFDIDVFAMTQALTADTRVLALASPNDPTGRAPDEETWASIARLAEARDLWVVVVDAGPRHLFRQEDALAPSLEQLRERLVLIDGLTLSFGAPEWRAAWMIAPAEAAARIDAYVRSNGLSPSRSGLIGAHEMLMRGRGAVERTRAALRRRSELLQRVLGESSDSRLLRAQPSMGGLFAMIDARPLATRLRLGDQELGDAVLAEAVYDECGVALMDGALFGDSSLGFLRLTLSIDEDSLTEAALRLARIDARC